MTPQSPTQVSRMYNGYDRAPELGEFIQVLDSCGRTCFESHKSVSLGNSTAPWGVVIGKQRTCFRGEGRGELKLTIYLVSSNSGRHEEQGKLHIPLPSGHAGIAIPEAFDGPLEIPDWTFQEGYHLIVRRRAFEIVKKWKAFKPPVILPESQVARLVLYERHLADVEKAEYSFIRPPLPQPGALSSPNARERTAHEPRVSEQKYLEIEAQRRLREKRIRIESWVEEVVEISGLWRKLEL